MTTASPTITGTRTTLADRYVVLPPSLPARLAGASGRGLVKLGQWLRPAVEWAKPIVWACTVWIASVGLVLFILVALPLLAIGGVIFAIASGVKAVGNWLGIG
jgi:hypothetical protein